MKTNKLTEAGNEERSSSQKPMRYRMKGRRPRPVCAEGGAVQRCEQVLINRYDDLQFKYAQPFEAAAKMRVSHLDNGTCVCFYYTLHDQKGKGDAKKGFESFQYRLDLTITMQSASVRPESEVVSIGFKSHAAATKWMRTHALLVAAYLFTPLKWDGKSSDDDDRDPHLHTAQGACGMDWLIDSEKTPVRFCASGNGAPVFTDSTLAKAKEAVQFQELQFRLLRLGQHTFVNETNTKLGIK